MIKDMNTLDSYFRQAADRPLTFSDEQVRGLLEAYDATAFRFDDITRPRIGRRLWRVLGIGLGAAAVVAIVYWSAPSTSTDPSVHREQDGQALKSASPTSARQDSPQLPEPSSASLRVGAARADAQPSAAGVTSIARVAGPTMIDLGGIETDAVGMRRLPGGRTAFAYYLVGAESRQGDASLDDHRLLQGGYSDSLLVRTIAPDGLRDVLMSRAAFPLGIVTRRASPLAASWQIVTDDQGRLLDKRIRPADAAQLRAVAALFARGAGDRAFGARRVDSLLGVDALSRELRLNTLIPIRVATGASDNPRAIFWCTPDPELLIQLPDRAIALLRVELEAAAAAVGMPDTVAIVRRGWALTVLQALDSLRPQALAIDNGLELAPSDRLTGGGVFGGSRRNAGAITRFAPTTTSTRGTLELALRLREPRALTVTLHKVTGERIATLLHTDILQEGDSMVTASVAGVPKGLYLLSVSTDRSENVVQRVVVDD